MTSSPVFDAAGAGAAGSAEETPVPGVVAGLGDKRGRRAGWAPFLSVEHVERLTPILDEMVPEGLVTMEKVQVLKYAPRPA